MNDKQYSPNSPIDNKKANLQLKFSTMDLPDVSEAKEMKTFLNFFLHGELMRQFLMDEDIWLFIQNMKSILKEDSSVIDAWLDNQLHLARSNSESLLNIDIPPFLNIKKSYECGNTKVEKEYDKCYLSCNNNFVKNNSLLDTKIENTQNNIINYLNNEELITKKNKNELNMDTNISKLVTKGLSYKEENNKKEIDKDHANHDNNKINNNHCNNNNDKFGTTYNNNNNSSSSSSSSSFNSKDIFSYLKDKNISDILQKGMNRSESLIDNEEKGAYKEEQQKEETHEYSTSTLKVKIIKSDNDNNIINKKSYMLKQLSNDIETKNRSLSSDIYEASENSEKEEKKKQKRKQLKLLDMNYQHTMENSLTSNRYETNKYRDSNKHVNINALEGGSLADSKRTMYNNDNNKTTITTTSSYNNNLLIENTQNVHIYIENNIIKDKQNDIPSKNVFFADDGYKKGKEVIDGGASKSETNKNETIKNETIKNETNGKQHNDNQFNEIKTKTNKITRGLKDIINKNAYINLNNTSITQGEISMNEKNEVEKSYIKNNNKLSELVLNKSEMSSINMKKTRDICLNHHDNLNDKNRAQPILIPKLTVNVGRLMNENRDKKLKNIFIQCNNKMDLQTFEKLIVVNYLKIGEYMSYTLFSKIPKTNNNFLTFNDVIKYFCNRFIDGSEDPSYYNDEIYVNLFNKKTKKDSFSNSNQVLNNTDSGFVPDGGTYNEVISKIDESKELGPNMTKSNELSSNLNDGSVIEDGTCSDNDRCINLLYKKCSIVNFFNAIKSDDKNYLEFKDFDMYVREILQRNKSLQFLLGHNEFLERYVESVIVRIYYHIDINDTNKIYLNDLRKNDLAHIWCCLDDSIKVQDIRQYFSYSHFYVYYFTFCQTSSCKDMLIDDNDLYRFDNHALNDFIVNRIWSKISIKLGGPNQKYMCLNDWIYFIMNYEDMTTNRSIEFWFKLIDLDANGIITDHEISVFFNIQSERLKSHYLEEPKLEDWLCQMNDAIQPSIEGNFTLSDLKKNKKYAAKFFGCLVSLSKLLAWEGRDVHRELQIETEYPNWTPWEFFCKTKYDELCYLENESIYDDNFDQYENNYTKSYYNLDSD
uniref:EF-hand domain-containing protein n=1 Tax=Piliocolobus tephrosceles TaxID=591936 RepID=A0A8C9GDP3_9PRIM